MITRWPLTEVQNEMSRLQTEMNRLLGRNGSRAYAAAQSYPALNLWEDEDQFTVEAELPGMNLADLEILVDGGNQLSIKGERKAPVAESGTWHRQERGFGSFKRMIALPSDVDTERVEAVFKDGILTISLPKSEEVKPRKINVKAQ